MMPGSGSIGATHTLSGASHAGGGGERPNVVLIMSDQHNARAMGCAGNAIVRTPNLDRLARQGVRFSSAYCPYPLCVPSRMGFMTAQYSSDVRVWDNGSILSSDVPTFAHALGAAGYEAVLCGRMHFEGPDQFHGFERRLYGDCNRFLSPEIVGRGWNRTNGQTKYAVEVCGYGRTGYQAYDANVTERACDWLARRDPGQRPYCLVVGYVLPHNPLICSRALFEYYLDALPVPAPLPESALERLHPAVRGWRERRGVDDLSPEQHHRALAAYYGLVTELDANVGRVLDALRSSPGAENTVVVYCSDHGDMASAHGMWWKTCHYEGAVCVPLIAAWPGRFVENRTVDAPLSLIDVGPTVLDLAGADPLPDVAGRSLVEFLRRGERPADWPDECFSECLGAHGDQPSCMIRSGPWKLIYYAGADSRSSGSYQLFHLGQDPEEMDDRAGDPACREVARALLERIHARWSAEEMRRGKARERRAQEVIRRCPHPPIPHPVANEAPPAGANQFDFAQVPGWEQIRLRFQE
jgi:choline-sulfatase